MLQVEVSDKLRENRECYTSNETTLRGVIGESLGEDFPQWDNEVCLPFSVTVDGREVVSLDDEIEDDALVEITLEPGASLTLFEVISLIVSIASAVYSFVVAGNIPDNYQNSAPDGDTLYRSAGRGNFARLWANVPELFGETRRYPDLIAPIWREFVRQADGKYIEVVHILANVGVGYNFTDDWKIGETSISAYPGNIQINVYQPGEPLGADEGAICQYTAPEVGGNRSSSGIEIRHRGEPIEYTYDFVGKCITAYVNGAPAAFPFSVGETFTYQRFNYIVVNIDGGTGEKATVERCAGIVNTPRRIFRR